jgi:hypothetical protein
MLEACPRCQSIFIEWDGETDQYSCLERKCQNTWGQLDNGPRTYDEVRNSFLKASLSPGQGLPAAKHATGRGESQVIESCGASDY